MGHPRVVVRQKGKYIDGFAALTMSPEAADALVEEEGLDGVPMRFTSLGRRAPYPARPT